MAQQGSDSVGGIESRPLLPLHHPVASGATWHSRPVPRAPLSSWPSSSEFTPLQSPGLQLSSLILTGSRLAQSKPSALCQLPHHLAFDCTAIFTPVPQKGAQTSNNKEEKTAIKWDGLGGCFGVGVGWVSERSFCAARPGPETRTEHLGRVTGLATKATLQWPGPHRGCQKQHEGLRLESVVQGFCSCFCK